MSVTLPAPSAGSVRPQTRFSYTSLVAYYKNSAGSIVAAPGPVVKLTATSACQTLASCAGTADEAKTTIAFGTPGIANNLLPTSTTSGSGNGALAVTTAQTYDAFSDVLTVDGPLAGTADTIRYRYDSVRRLVGTVGPDPDGAGALKHRAQRITYNGDGNVTKVEQGRVNSQSDADWNAFAALQAADMTYDSLGRKLTEKVSTYTLAQYSYDAKGRLECTAMRMNPAAFGALPGSACTLGTQGNDGPDRIARSVFDAADQVTKMQVAVGTADAADEVSMSYTTNGKPLYLTDGKGNVSRFYYDGHDRRSHLYFPSKTTTGTIDTGDVQMWVYDAAGNLAYERKRDASYIYYTYDNLNRLTLKNLPNTAFAEYDISYAYNNLGRLTSATDTSTRYASFTYDALGRVTGERSVMGLKVMAYDLAGRMTRLTHVDGFFVDYDYLVTGEVSKIRENGATSGIGVLATFGYDDLGRRTSLTRGNGTVTSYAYDYPSRLTSLTQDLVGSVNDLTLTLGYNPSSELTFRTRSNNVYAFPQANGSTASTVNGLNQLVTQGGAAISHDAKGNITNDGVRTFGYTAENRLATSLSANFYHDTMGRLFYSTAVPTRFDFAGSAMVAEHDGGDILIRRYVWGPGVDEPLVWYEGGGTADRRFLHADERGSIVAISNSAGSATAINKYDEYGAPAATNIGRFQFTGQKWLSEVELYDFKGRMYWPKGPRFMQFDPSGYADGPNGYAYVKGNPVNFTDPSGRSRIDYYRMYMHTQDQKTGTTSRAGQQFSSSFFAGSLQTRGYFRSVFRPSNTPTRGIDENGDGTEEEIIVTGGRWVYEYVEGRNFIADHARFSGFNRSTPGREGQSGPTDFCGSKGTEAVPDEVGSASLAIPCGRHDGCYATSGASKLGCDIKLGLEVYLACFLSGTPLQACGAAGASYFIGVAVAGGRPFRDAQAQSLRRPK